MKTYIREDIHKGTVELPDYPPYHAVVKVTQKEVLTRSGGKCGYSKINVSLVRPDTSLMGGEKVVGKNTKFVHSTSELFCSECWEGYAAILLNQLICLNVVSIRPVSVKPLAP